MTFREQKPAYRCFRAMLFGLAIVAVSVMFFGALGTTNTRHTASDYATVLQKKN
jgi:purine-cytosine permease-like protein